MKARLAIAENFLARFFLSRTKQGGGQQNHYLTRKEINPEDFWDQQSGNN